ncbi:MAG TPA: 3-oxoacyl-[acyl-carrier-protein] synthase III C-terminal domain-containing protein [Candidatus Acidoferrales bacterium]|nr:3-oxoacyl-[acyl-carrier-protein] synthase III C-terminal domain-containing protein [Candidatus Acidoferrales bacterium]
MPKLISISTAEPPTKVEQTEVREFVHELFSRRRDDIDRLMKVFENSSIASRHFTEDRSWYGKEHGFAERNELYIRSAVRLSEECSTKCLNGAGLKPSEIHHVVFISSTGLSTPSIDARLFNTMRFNPHIKRTPIWGLGCAGGAAGLSRVLEYTTAMPAHAALLIAVELCGLTFQKDDYSKNNLVGTSLFSDGAAAAVIVGDEHPLSKDDGATGYPVGISLLNSLSTIFDNSLDVMGWDIADNGLKVIFSKDIPTIVHKCVRQNVEELAKETGINLSDIKHFAVHPGGPKVMDAYENALGLRSDALRFSRKVLREHGNMSSPTVLYVLKEFIESREFKPGEYGLISALGPGFSSELVLFKTN